MERVRLEGTRLNEVLDDSIFLYLCMNIQMDICVSQGSHLHDVVPEYIRDERKDAREDFVQGHAELLQRHRFQLLLDKAAPMLVQGKLVDVAEYVLRVAWRNNS